MDPFPKFLIIGIIFSVLATSNAQETFNVLDYGAVGDGATDSSQAFLKAWKATCDSTTDNPTLVIPIENKFLVNPVVFNGPCKAKNITFLISGEIVAPTSPSSWKGLDPGQWLVFNGVTGLNMTGSGQLNGRGSQWWDQSCRDHPKLDGCTSLAPTILKLLSCNETSISNLLFLNSSQAHITFLGCNGVNVDNLTILAPELSPNTDGIHLQSTHRVLIQNTRIGSGDDCVSIGDYTSDINITHLDCGPGHGISIGSLGRAGNFVQVEKIHVSHVNFNGTTNGARIKTWQVGTGFVRDVSFENVNFTSVKNPIIIDQNYCDVRGKCKELPTGVHISNVKYMGLQGTSSTPVAINLNCSRTVPCTGLVLESINLTPADKIRQVTANCYNAHGCTIGTVEPNSCLQE